MSEKREYAVICQSFVGNPHTGYRIHYGFDGEKFATSGKAIEHGFRLRGSDDFNIAVLDGPYLAGFCWMDDPMETDMEELVEVSKAIFGKISISMADFPLAPTTNPDGEAE